MEVSLVRTLAQTGPLSLTSLAKQLDIKTIPCLSLIGHINQLEPGLIKNHDYYYQLSRTLDWLDPNELSQQLTAAGCAHQVMIHDQLASTNSYALTHSHKLTPPAIVSCEWQMAGRGRFGRRWLSGLAQDLTVSFVYHFGAEMQTSLIPIVAAVAINRLFKSYQIRNKIKWPNDIYVDNQKVAGILVENISRAQANYTVIGIGIANLAQIRRTSFLTALTIELSRSLREFEIFGFPLLRREWLDNCIHLGYRLRILHQGQLVSEGVHCDLSANGELVLDTATGRQTFNSSACSIQFEMPKST